ncbi:MAG: carboxypeptidase regulatory-like domain-containing protein [Oscillibacter sp.]|nr:carboxypeptidase regulatory-like domain-containing protein [Oscillibacter sp.]
MIRRRVSAALLVRDGFTGQPFASGSVFLCRLNGLPVRPVFKNGGYLVLTDLKAGEHTLSLSAGGFQTEIVRLTIPENQPLEMEVSMRPGPRYAFPPDTARLHVDLAEGDGPLGGEAFWVGWPAPVQLRLARSAEAGETGEIRMYCSGAPALLPVPGHFLLLDDQQPELVRLKELQHETGVLDGFMAHPHQRGTVFVPAMRFQSGEDGSAELAFPRGGTISLFCRGRLKNVELGPGASSVRWAPEEA